MGFGKGKGFTEGQTASFKIARTESLSNPAVVLAGGGGGATRTEAFTNPTVVLALL